MAGNIENESQAAAVMHVTYIVRMLYFHNRYFIMYIIYSLILLYRCMHSFLNLA
jgi:hypothetical protein